VPRTEMSKKHAHRFCGDCGYELAPDSEGTCPMCPRFEQLRIDSIAPKASELAAQRAEPRDTDVSGAPDERSPTVAEYRAILAERGIGSTSADPSRGRVIRTPALRHIPSPHPPSSAAAADDEALASPVSPRAPGQETSATPPKRAKGEDDAGRAAGVRAPSLPSAEGNTPLPTPRSSAAPTAADVPSTNDQVAPQKKGRAQSVVAAAESAQTPRQDARSLMHGPRVRHVQSRSRAGVSPRWLVTVAVVAATALIGSVVAILLSLL